MKTTWTKDELKAYLLIYAANANFVESSDEIELIQSKIAPDVYKKMHKEFENDNDIASIDKIEATLTQPQYNDQEKAQLLLQLQELFASDGSFDILERNLFSWLKKILS